MSQSSEIPQELFDNILPKVLRYISYRPRSEYETRRRLKAYLKNSQVSETEKEIVIEAFVRYLVEIRLLSDEQFVQDYVASLSGLSKSRSLNQIKRYFLQRGISTQLIDEGLAAVNPEAEFDFAMKVAQKRLVRLAGKEKSVQKAEVKKYLFGKGYTYSVVERVIDTIFEVK